MPSKKGRDSGGMGSFLKNVCEIQNQGKWEQMQSMEIPNRRTQFPICGWNVAFPPSLREGQRNGGQKLGTVSKIIVVKLFSRNGAFAECRGMG
ncbi:MULTISPECIES: hypothetical protein [Aequorivita]|uniref:Uncharacterized protein n=1 Tax=Aequorivita iocasae TaxID=2803865 RepID=A0ABX7DQX7_9FLAO|nr:MULTISPECIES: hypothetical protein [Aequorivita]QQX76499.1 hypothetical protein JK629_14420 [Aequorivita iocasae]UCA55972.1 hypothetical protein LDL78_14490 [Aequorivita sp. F7]